MRYCALCLLLLPSLAWAYPDSIGEAVDAQRHAFWPVRVRSLDRIAWRWSEGARTGFAAPVANGPLRIQAGGGGIRAVDPVTGKRSWIEPGSMGHWNYSACVLGPGGVAYGGNYDWFRAVDANGKRLWEAHLDARWIHAPPALSPDGRTLYCSGDALGIAALDAANGRVRWLRRDFGSPGTRYAFDAAGHVIAAHGHATVCYADNGVELWRIEEPLRDPMVVGDLLVVTRGHEVRAYRLADHKIAWRFDAGCGLGGMALREDGRIVVALASGQLALLDARSGELRRREGVSDDALLRPVTALCNETLVGDARGGLYLLDGNLRVVSTIDTGAPIYGWRPTLSPDGLVYICHPNTVLCIGGDQRPAPPALVAAELTIVADDFVVDIWHNGNKVPLTARRMLAEVFGATSERVTLDVREGDWLVFHVVANRLRWNGSAYFGVGARDATGAEAFRSAPGRRWSCCDDPAKVKAFIAERDAGADRLAVAPKRPWQDAPLHWRAHYGEFKGAPVWGHEASTWIKVQVARDLRPEAKVEVPKKPKWFGEPAPDPEPPPDPVAKNPR